MEIFLNKPPRVFHVGKDQKIQLKDCARIELCPDEQITLVTESGAEYDIARKSWGFYATPSLNSRLKRFGFRSVLVKSPDGKFFIYLVEKDKKEEFNNYIQSESIEIITWLDDEKILKDFKMGVEAR